MPSPPAPVSLRRRHEPGLQALQTRQPDAWLAFYDAYAPYVLSVLRRIMGTDDELSDLVQEVFSRALESIGRVRDADKLKPWLRSLTVFTARALLKKRRWRRWIPLADESDDDSPPAGHLVLVTSDALDERRVLRRVKVALDRLAVDERLCFTLRHFEGLELTEVAEATGLSLSTVKRRLARAQRTFETLTRADAEIAAWRAEGRFSES